MAVPIHKTPRLVILLPSRRWYCSPISISSSCLICCFTLSDWRISLANFERFVLFSSSNSNCVGTSSHWKAPFSSPTRWISSLRTGSHLSATRIYILPSEVVAYEWSEGNTVMAKYWLPVSSAHTSPTARPTLKQSPRNLVTALFASSCGIT